MWSLERQFRLTAGLILFVSILLAYSVSSSWIFLPALLSLEMAISAFTKNSVIMLLLSQLPWNRATTIEQK